MSQYSTKTKMKRVIPRFKFVNEFVYSLKVFGD